MRVLGTRQTCNLLLERLAELMRRRASRVLREFGQGYREVDELPKKSALEFGSIAIESQRTESGSGAKRWNELLSASD
jgi:hypothetical protein